METNGDVLTHFGNLTVLSPQSNCQAISCCHSLTYIIIALEARVETARKRASVMAKYCFLHFSRLRPDQSGFNLLSWLGVPGGLEYGLNPGAPGKSAKNTPEKVIVHDWIYRNFH